MELLTESVLAFLGLRSCDFLAPVRIGDTVNAKMRVISKRETEKGDRGIVTFGVSVYNQGKEALRCEQLMMVAKKSMAQKQE